MRRQYYYLIRSTRRIVFVLRIRLVKHTVQVLDDSNHRDT